MKFIIPIIIILLSYQHSYSQGCGDGGACTIESFSPNHISKKNKSSLAFGISGGLADYDIGILGNYISYITEISKSVSLELKLTSLLQGGNGIVRWGLSDAFLNLNYRANRNHAFTLGYKYPINYADDKNNGNTLPMDYQSSLGTQDLILVYAYSQNQFQIAIGSQIVIQQNKNAFNPIDFTGRLSEFQNTNGFNRSSDIILRASYLIDINDKWSITPTVVPIYHLANDEYLVVEDDIERSIEIDGSQGLTFNVGSYFDYKISKRETLRFNLALPLYVREARPEGLTRAFVANAEIKVYF